MPDWTLFLETVSPTSTTSLGFSFMIVFFRTSLHSLRVPVTNSPSGCFRLSLWASVRISLDTPDNFSGNYCLSQRTRSAYLPAAVIPILLATPDADGSIITTSPLQSSLRLVDLQLGHTGPLLMNLQFLQALSLKPPFPHEPLSFALCQPLSSPASLRRVGAS